MDNDTKKILLLIARALQASALAELAKTGGLGLIKKAAQDDALVAEELLMKINNEEKKREAHQKHMDEVRMDETWRKDRRPSSLGGKLGRKPNEAEKNNV